MNKFIRKYSDYFRFVIILVIVLVVITAFHIMYKNITINNNLVESKNIKEVSRNDINYNDLKDSLNDIEGRVIHGEDVSFNENVYMVDYYKSASNIYRNKLIEIEDIIKNKLLDDDVKSALAYDIEKFFLELDNDDEEKKRLYESTIEASLNIYKNRYEKTREKCYKVIDDYKVILDK